MMFLAQLSYEDIEEEEYAKRNASMGLSALPAKTTATSYQQT